MENPNTWTKVERTINDALTKAAHNRAKGVIGASTAKQVADALRHEGLLKEPDAANLTS